MKKIVLAVLFFIPLIACCQSDVLLLQKNGRNIKTYAPGEPIIFETIYQQWFSGTLTALRNDSVFINYIPFHYHEIKTMRVERTRLNYAGDGSLLIIAGVGGTGPEYHQWPLPQRRSKELVLHLRMDHRRRADPGRHFVKKSPGKDLSARKKIWIALS
jgi:hypothetical protein